jgi:hypothetical protein
MKPSMLGLFIAAAAFGASTIYLGVQLKDERARADQVIEQSRQLSARITELEKARAELEAMRLVSDYPAMNAAPELAGPHGTPPVAQAAGPEALGRDQDDFRRSPGAVPRSEAMQKMMRTQLRMNLNRVNADLGEKLGLSKEETSQLLNLLVEQQMAMMERGRQERGSSLTPEQRAASLNEQQQKNLAEVSALIGADKMDAYQAYQESLPARQEVDMLAHQLAAGDAGLSKEQRDRLVTALAEERKRVPAPKIADSTSREEFTQAMATWQEDYNQRAASRAASILDSEQQAAYTEYQEWNREMRQQFEERRAARRKDSGPSPAAAARQP